MRERRIPTSARVAAIIALALACKAPTQRVAMDEVHDCRPGGSAYRCIALGPKGARLFPSGRLESVTVRTNQVIKGEKGEIMPDNPHVFLHMMMFKFGHADVFDVLRAELGEPDGHVEPRHGELPIDTVYVRTARGTDYWKTEDGYWICEEDDEDGGHTGLKTVTWVSKPFPVDPEATDISVWERGVDRYVRAAPKAAAIWDKLGRTLIGSAPAPK